MADTKISLEQWRALVGVVEAGGYAQAAQHLHKSQSALTYAVQKIESLLGLPVFQIKGRKAVLTAAGQVLYRRGKLLLDEAARLERLAGALAAGEEAELRLAAETMFPTWLLLECLGRLGEERPDLRVELFETVLGGTEEAMAQGRVDLAITDRVPAGWIGEPLLHVRFVAVAHPEHALHQMDRPLTLDDLRPYRHIVIRDSGALRSRSAGWLNERRWTVSHKATFIRALCMGLGYAWVPEQNIRRELEQGSLKPLPLAEGAERYATLYLVLRDGDAAGPAARRLAELVRERVGGVTKQLPAQC